MGSRVVQRTTARAVTLVELLVAIGILCLLMAILLPALGHAWSSARRAQCRNRLRQLGTALAAYQADHDVFPAAASFGAIYSPQCALLPYLDQPAVYNAINFSARQYGSPQNWTVLRTALSCFVCPVDGGRPRSEWFMAYQPQSYCSYRVNVGAHAHAIDKQEPGQAWGPFQPGRWLRPGDITDGLNQTIFMSEKLSGDGDNSIFRQERDWWLPGAGLLVRIPPLPTDSIRRICEGLPAVQRPPHKSHYGLSWLFGGYVNTWDNHVSRPNSSIPDCAGDHLRGEHPWSEDRMLPGVRTARSNHGGGVNCLFGDGHVEFVSDEVDEGLWRALGTREGGERL